MATQYEYELEEEMSPLHEYEQEADPFFERIRRAIGGLARRALPLLKRLAPIAARLVTGAIPGVGAVAGPLAGKLVGALTQEQQQELEAVLHEATAAHEMGGLHSEFESIHPEYEGSHPEWEASHPEFESVHPEYEGLHPEWEASHPEFESIHPEYEGSHPEYEGSHPEWEASHPEYEGLHPEYEGYHPETPSGMHPEMHPEAHPESHLEAHPESEAGLPHSEATHLEAQLMEQIAHEASVAASEAEAEALVGSLVPMAIRSIRSGAPAFRTAAPALARAAGRLTGALRRSPATRPLIRTLPTILRRTRAVLARQAAQGAPVTPRTAVRAMANQTYRVIGNPTVCIRILVRSGRICRRCRRAV